MRSESAFNASTIAMTSSENARQFPELDPAFLTASEGRAGTRAVRRHKLHTKGNAAVTSEIDGGLPRPYKELHGKGGAKGKELQGIKLVLKESFQDLLDAVSTNVVFKVCSYSDGEIRLRQWIKLMAVSLLFSGVQGIQLEYHWKTLLLMFISPLVNSSKEENRFPSASRYSCRSLVLILLFPTSNGFKHDAQMRVLSPSLLQVCQIAHGEQHKLKPVIAPGNPILVDGPSHLHTESIVGSGYLRCRCRPAGNLVQDIAMYKLGTSQLPSLANVNTDNSGLKGKDDNKTIADFRISSERFNVLGRAPLIFLINIQILTHPSPL